MESYYPSLSVPSHTSRFTLNYPRSRLDLEAYHRTSTQDKIATKYLQSHHNENTTFQEVETLSRKQALDRSRMHFDIHLLNSQNQNDYEWAGAVALLRMEGEGISSLDVTQDSQDANPSQDRIGEVGVMLTSASHRKSIFSEAAIFILDLAFTSPASRSSPVSPLNSRNGFDLSKIFLVTHNQNVPMRGFAEKALGMEQLEIDSEDLTQSLRKMMQDEMGSDDRAVVYCLKRESWLGGGRDQLIDKVERKVGKNAK